MPNPMESLQTLMRMKSPSQVQTGDPWLARRQGEIASGLDEFLPDADSPDYKMQQIEDAQRTGVSMPRADYRSGHLAQLRQMLGLKEMEQSHELQKSVLGQQAQMDRILAAQQAQTGRTAMQQEGQSARGEADRAAREAALEQRLGSMESQQQARDAAAMERAQFNQGQMSQRQEAKRPKSIWERIGLFGGGEEETPAEAPVATTPGRRIISVR